MKGKNKFKNLPPTPKPRNPKTKKKSCVIIFKKPLSCPKPRWRETKIPGNWLLYPKPRKVPSPQKIGRKTQKTKSKKEDKVDRIKENNQETKWWWERGRGVGGSESERDLWRWRESKKKKGERFEEGPRGKIVQTPLSVTDEALYLTREERLGKERKEEEKGNGKKKKEKWSEKKRNVRGMSVLSTQERENFGEADNQIQMDLSLISYFLPKREMDGGFGLWTRARLTEKT